MGITLSQLREREHCFNWGRKEEEENNVLVENDSVTILMGVERVFS